ncbi:MAG: OmpA family protein [Bacteroidales bacterium]|nr:OmpA family protein [Bacteroidales bacterium]
MKKFFAFAAALLIGVAAFAQETNKDENGNTKFGGYETNKFLDNWFVGAGIGANGWIDDITNIARSGESINKRGATFPAIDAFVGKWIEPCYGVRLGWAGLKYQKDAAVEPNTDEKFSINNIHLDLLWNISNQFWGYKENRFYNLSPYATAALVWTAEDRTAGAGVGLFNQFRLSDKLGLYIDLRSIFATPRVIGNVGGGVAILGSVTGGLTYGFGRTNWTRVSTTAAAAAAAIAAADAARKAAEAKVAGAQKAAADADAAAKKALDEANQIKDEAARAAADATNINGLFDEPVVVYFEIGKSTLTAAEKAHAEYAIKNIVSRGDNVKFTLGGSADTKTGTAKRNKQLSEQRAKTVYNLIDELGVSRDNITVVEWDGKTQRFATNELNRAVIIEKQ